MLNRVLWVGAIVAAAVGGFGVATGTERPPTRVYATNEIRVPTSEVPLPQRCPTPTDDVGRGVLGR